MVSQAVTLGVVSGIIGAVVLIIVVVLFCLCRTSRKPAVSSPHYESIGEYKPSSVVSVSTSSQEIQLTREHKTVQPRLMSTPSRSSIRSDQFTDDTSSLSAKSDTSVDSSVFEASFGIIRPDLYPRKDAVLQQSSVDRTLGRLHMRLKYDFRTSDLVVHLIEAQDLPPSDMIGGFSDPYVKLFLRPEVDDRLRQSSVKRKTLNPLYNEYFKFPIPFDDLHDRRLHFLMFDYDKFSRHEAIGEVTVDLNRIDVSTSVEMWCDLQKCLQATGSCGELLVSLSYLPTAERLTVVVMKAKELRVPNMPTPSVCRSTGLWKDDGVRKIDVKRVRNPYVRVSLVIEGKKIKRKKTTVMKGTVIPVWNEALVFNVPTELLSKVSLEISVLDHDLLGHGDLLGQCFIGPDRPGTGANHWRDMMQNHRKAIAMWHNLQK